MATPIQNLNYGDSILITSDNKEINQYLAIRSLEENNAKYIFPTVNKNTDFNKISLLLYPNLNELIFTAYPKKSYEFVAKARQADPTATSYALLMRRAEAERERN